MMPPARLGQLLATAAPVRASGERVVGFLQLRDGPRLHGYILEVGAAQRAGKQHRVFSLRPPRAVCHVKVAAAGEKHHQTGLRQAPVRAGRKGSPQRADERLHQGGNAQLGFGGVPEPWRQRRQSGAGHVAARDFLEVRAARVVGVRRARLVSTAFPRLFLPGSHDHPRVIPAHVG